MSIEGYSGYYTKTIEQLTSNIARIIGKKGETIKKLEKTFKVQINIAKDDHRRSVRMKIRFTHFESGDDFIVFCRILFVWSRVCAELK